MGVNKERRMGLSSMGRAWAGCAALAVALLGGCGGGAMTTIHNDAEFQATVIASHQVVLVDFYKGLCPTCIALDGVMDKLARDYKGKVVVAKFKLVQPYFVVTSQKLKDQYDIHFFPTAVLFADGKEVKRFIIKYDEKLYRKALDGLVGGPTPKSLPPTTQLAR
jgi:thioredoxin 1